MAEISLNINNDKEVSIKELNLILEEVRKLTDVKVIIGFQNGVRSISLVFYAGLFLLHKDRNLTFHIKGSVFRTQDGFPRIFLDDKYAFEARYYLSQIAALYGPFEPNWIQLEDVTTDNGFESYQFFSPVLLVNKENNALLFGEKSESLFAGLKNKYIDSLNKHRNADESFYYDHELDENGEPDKQHILFLLRSHAPIYTFVYCLVHAIDSPFVDNENGLKDAKKRIRTLFQFTKRFVSGLEELAKNIVEHSETKQGVIAIRAYRDGEGGKWDRNLETFVFDYGAVGIIPTLINDLENDIPIEVDMQNAEGPLKEAREDLDMLHNQYTLAKFFTPGGTFRLTRQIRREMAHLGLLHFMSLIRSNNGLCRISTTGTDGKRDPYGDIGLEEYELSEGTSFAFFLPVSRHFSETGKIGANRLSSMETEQLTLSQQAIAAMPQIFSIDKIETVRMRSFFPNDGKIIKINSRVQEKVFLEKIPFDGSEHDFRVIDFGGFEFVETSLLRILSMISEKSDQKIIGINIDSEVLIGMIDDNTTYMKFISNGTIPFWIQDKSMLIYSRMEDKGFYFADFLYGGSERAFFGVNRIVSSVFPNLVSIVSDCDDMMVANTEDAFGEGYCDDPPVRDYFYKKTLLPFDMLIKSDERSLFSHNLLTVVLSRLN